MKYLRIIHVKISINHLITSLIINYLIRHDKNNNQSKEKCKSENKKI